MNSKKYVLSLLSLLFLYTPTAALNKWNITAIYAFGDSLLDPGNNNGLMTFCRSNHSPYGMAFPDKAPSGRFSNGKLTLDFVISALGIKNLLPAYKDPAVTDEALLTGASFASACSGLDDLTSILGGALSLTAQLKNFQEAVERIRGIVGKEKAGWIVEKSLFVIAVGTNDVMSNYILPSGPMHTIAEYHDMMLRNLETLVMKLVGLGAVRFAVMGLPPVGCLPLQVTLNSITSAGTIIKRECSAEHNSDSQAYNRKLQSLITRWQTNLNRTSIVYGDMYNPIMDIFLKPQKLGFERTLEGCCGSGAVEIGPMCNSNSAICRNPSKFLFWDAVHPTQETCKIYAKYFHENVLPKLKL